MLPAVLQALQFHHIDPEAKSFGIGAVQVSKGIEALRAEAQKCVLLCANCHVKVEEELRSGTVFAL